MKRMIMSMTLTTKRQSVFPLDWCKREGLEHGGPVNVFDLGDQGLLIQPVKLPDKGVLDKILDQAPYGNHSPREAAAVVNRALSRVRRESGRH